MLTKKSEVLARYGEQFYSKSFLKIMSHFWWNCCSAYVFHYDSPYALSFSDFWVPLETGSLWNNKYYWLSGTVLFINVPFSKKNFTNEFSSFDNLRFHSSGNTYKKSKLHGRQHCGFSCYKQKMSKLRSMGVPLSSYRRLQSHF